MPNRRTAFVRQLFLVLLCFYARPAPAPEYLLPEIHISPGEFAEHVHQHWKGVGLISRIWWQEAKKDLFPNATVQEEKLMMDLLADLTQVHDVAKWGSRWRRDPRFEGRFDRLEAELNRLRKRDGPPFSANAPRQVARGSDLLLDITGVNIKDKSLPADVYEAANAVVQLINDIDSAATKEILEDPRFRTLSNEAKYKILGGVSLSDLAHRHRSSQIGLLMGAVEIQAITKVEFGRELMPTSSYLVMMKGEGKAIPGVPDEYAKAYGIDLAIAHAQRLEASPRVVEIAKQTTLLTARGYALPCRFDAVAPHSPFLPPAKKVPK